MSQFDTPQKNTENLTSYFSEQKGPIQWMELQRYFAAGTAIHVDESLDLVDVAVQMALDNSEELKNWMRDGMVKHVSDDLAREWTDSDRTLHAVVVNPWVLVQRM